jgi:N-acetylglucosaminyl-diphospho-decaprenol L-rhamnosyltransferase
VHRVTIITVTYNATEEAIAWADALARARRQLEPAAQDQLTVIAVDNASPDGTAAALRRHAPWVDVIDMGSNAGFAAACNRGAQRAGRADLIVFINPDVTIGEEFVRTVMAIGWDRSVAAIGPHVIGRDGLTEQSARRFPRASTGLVGRTTLLTRLLPRLAEGRELLAEPGAGARDVDWVSGACIVISGDAWNRVGPFDDGYWMYWEDADWCKRARDAGLRTRYEPCLVVTHRQGASAASRSLATTVAFHRSAARYYRQHVAGSAASAQIAHVALLMRCAEKLVAAAVRSRRRGRRQDPTRVS